MILLKILLRKDDVIKIIQKIKIIHIIIILITGIIASQIFLLNMKELK